MYETEKNPKRGLRYYDTYNPSRVKRRYHDVSVAIFYHALVVVIQRYYDCVTVNCFVMIGAKTRHHNNQVAIKKMNGLRRLDENKITTTSAIRKSSTCRGWSNFIIDTETGSSSISKMSVRQQQKQHYPKSISPLRSKNFPTKMMLRQRRWTFHNRFHSRNTYIVLFCQLLGMNCSNESEMTVQWLSSSISWDHFCQRGGQTDVHKDGWGLLYYMNDKGGGGIRQFHDVESAATSPLASFIGSQPIVTRNLLAHIRYATSGSVNIANVHPFTREMWAINWCFCHNGQVPLFEDHPNYQLGVRRSDDGNNSTINHQQQEQQRYYNPIGTTDSEATFCAILNALRNEFLTTMPSLPVLYEKIQSLCTEIVEYNPTGTILNFLLTCGPYVMWVYSWPGKRPGSTVWNGLYYSVRDQSANISDEDIDVMVSVKNNDDNGTKQQNMASNGNQQTINGKYSSENRNNICIVATKPLTTDDDWIELKPGELILLDEGIPNVTPTELFRVELQGHGMSNDGKVLNPPKLQEDMRRYAINPEYFVGSGI